MTEPTDEEIMELAKSFITRVGSHWEHDDAIPDDGRIEDFARAVLAKWGTPPAVAGEPFCYVSVNKQGDITRTMKRKDKWTNIPLYITPQPTQAQAGAVPLTDEQIERAAKKIAECMDYPWGHMPTIGREEMRIHARAVLEAAHGIKGGQHG